MKQRDIIGLLVAAVILIVAGVLLYSQLAPAPKDSGILVTVPSKLSIPGDDEASQLKDLRLFTDFSQPQKCEDNPDLCASRGKVLQ